MVLQLVVISQCNTSCTTGVISAHETSEPTDRREKNAQYSFRTADVMHVFVSGRHMCINFSHGLDVVSISCIECILIEV